MISYFLITVKSLVPIGDPNLHNRSKALIGFEGFFVKKKLDTSFQV